MKDLDFDELDRAVNSLVSTVPDTNPKTTEKPEKMLDIDTGQLQQSSAAQPTTPSVPQTAMRRSTGRFMDVVHPSSDMRSSLVMPERASHSDATIEPVTKTPLMPDSAAPSSEPPSAPAPSSTFVPPAPKSNTRTDWPDPIDFTGYKKNDLDKDKALVKNATVTKEDIIPDTDEDDDINQISEDITNTINQKANQPLESPFISGTKVDKRPLGTFSISAPTTEAKPYAPLSLPEKEKNTGGMIPQLNSVITPLPAELQDDLLLIESETATQPVDKSNVADVVAPASVPVPVPELVSVPEPTLAPAPTEVATPTLAPAPVVSEPDKEPTGPASIVQQYKEKPSSGDQNTGAIFDTNVYHKAPVYPVKKKSGLSWILWIIILLIIGAGAGAAVYYFVLPML